VIFESLSGLWSNSYISREWLRPQGCIIAVATAGKSSSKDVAKLAGLFLIADAFVAIAIYASLGAGVVRTWMLVLGVVEALGLVVYFGSAIWDSLPKSVQKSLE